MAKKRLTKSELRVKFLTETGYKFAKELRQNSTKWEQKILKILKELGENFKFQLPIICRKTHLYIADFYFPDRGLILEIDGKATHAIPERMKADKLRTRRLKKEGFHVRRLWNSQVEKINTKEELLEILNIPVK